MKKIVFFLSFLLCYVNCYAQTLEGTVFDNNKNPISGVSVYLDGTTLGTSTDENGKYILTANSKINTNLVFRFIGYETYFASNVFENNFQKVYLQPKVESLEEVTISSELLSRAIKLKIFKQVFLGNTKGGLSCKILNEDDISLRFNSKTQTLKASSNNPIIIENDYLDYKIQFDIYNFEAELLIDTKDVSLKSRGEGFAIKRSLYFGTTSYTDIAQNQKVKEKRNKAYYGSSKHFFQNLSNDNWNKDEFLLFKGKYQTNPKLHFAIEKQGDLKKITVLHNQKNEVLLNKKTDFYATFNVLFNKRKQSKIAFYTDTLYVDSYGNTSNISDIEYGGIFSNSKVGDMLPMDFIPSQK